MTSLSDVSAIAYAARRAFEAEPLLLTDGSWIGFPYGCCNDACLLLAELYRDRGMRAVIVYGERDGGRSHVWLTVDGVIVDATADQFGGEGMPAVYVARTSAWHDGWRLADEDDGVQAISHDSEDTASRAHLLAGLDALRERVRGSERP